MALFGDFYETYLNAVKREVEEDVTVGTTFTNQIVALLNDDSNEVGSVHLGVVHLWTLDAPEVARREQMITQMTFMSLPELHAAENTLETWSALCLGYLDTLAASK
jgi:predicted NUDIX family phosphoesterase